MDVAADADHDAGTIRPRLRRPEPVRRADGDFLLRRGLKRGLAATLLLLLVLAVVVLPLMAMAPGLGERLTQAAGRLQDYFAGAPQLPPRLAGLRR